MWGRTEVLESQLLQWLLSLHFSLLVVECIAFRNLGNPLTRICQVIVAFFKKLNVKVPTDLSLLYEIVNHESVIHGSRKLEHTDKLFDKSTIDTQSDYIGESLNPWRLCTVTQVEELKSVIRLLPVWASKIVFSTVYSQMNTMLPCTTESSSHLLGNSQAMNEASPCSNEWVIGLVLSIFTMIIPVGCAEVFILVGQLEFFYDQAPDAMRSLLSALSLTTDSLGNYLSTVLVITVTKKTTQGGKLEWISDNLNRGHLHYFFCLLALLNLLNFLVYLWIARWYTYKKVAGHL
ncbi:Protein NRT1/ PTR FAMILY 8.1 [Hibiscus syriacus]|uniref:Protein NRT1/ PTR FAMILY 8.1 n=1 Tax=Hibiscus syriacus TaxID=106335 RepID=A0A6A3BL99_HIBSY|nr:Protein NRT1/ PTR FAMILY 8.1 [Hibiscus syriacus]